MARETRDAARERGWDNPAELLATLVSGRNPDGTLFDLPVTNAPAVAAGEGRFYLATTGRVTLNLAGNVRVTFANPAASGKTILAHRISVFTSSIAYAALRINPTTGVPGAAPRPVTNAVLGGGVPAVGQVRVDTDTTVPLGGGIDTGLVLAVGAGQRESVDLPPFILAAGVTLGANIPFAGAGDAVFAVYWSEL